MTTRRSGPNLRHAEERARSRLEARTAVPTRLSQGALSARRLTLAILALGYVAILTANLPGHLSYDSIVQLADGHVWRFHTWHPPAMAWLLGVGDHLLPGSAVYMAAQAALLFGALAAWIATRARVSWAAPVVAALMIASPLTLIYQGIVWKDVLFADATTAGFLALGLGAAARRRGERIALTAVAFALFGLAALVRQNGVGVPLFGAGALAWMLRRRLGPGSWRRATVTAVGALVVTVALAFAAEAALMSRRVDVPGPAAQLQNLQGYDVIGAVAHDPSIDLSALRSPALAARVRRAARTVYSPERVDTLSNDDGLEDDLTAAAPAVAAQWREILTRHTGAWLAHRWQVFRWTAFPPVMTRCVPVFVGVDGPPELMTSLGLTTAPRPQDAALRRYAAAFYRTPVFAHLAYALISALAAAWLLLRPRGAEDIAVGVLQLAALSFAASFALIGIACDYRYLYALDVAAMVAVLHLAIGRSRSGAEIEFRGVERD